MSDKQNQKSTEQGAAKDAKKAADKDASLKDESKKKLDYVFKIVPADPKNNFDFEDVADK